MEPNADRMRPDSGSEVIDRVIDVQVNIMDLANVYSVVKFRWNCLFDVADSCRALDSMMPS